MHATIDRFAKSSLLTSEEASIACDAESAGTEYHTIGYEVEVLPSARQDIAKARDSSPDENLRARCRQRLSKFGYDVGSDGLYELQSPAAMHSFPLSIATRGLARFGWLPKKGSKGLVTSHVSIGTATEIREHNYSKIYTDSIMLLRAIEVFGGSTPTRLNAPLKRAHAGTRLLADSSWNQKGCYGVKMEQMELMDKKKVAWKGDNSRIEFRTLGYHNPRQYGAMLDAVYYLTRAMFTSHEGASDVYGEYYDWISDYYDACDLPTVDPGADADMTDVLDRYLTPYVNHLAHADLSEFRNKTSETIHDLREEFRMTEIPLNDKHLTSSGAGLPFSK